MWRQINCNVISARLSGKQQVIRPIKIDYQKVSKQIIQPTSNRLVILNVNTESSRITSVQNITLVKF